MTVEQCGQNNGLQIGGVMRLQRAAKQRYLITLVRYVRGPWKYHH